METNRLQPNARSATEGLVDVDTDTLPLDQAAEAHRRIEAGT